MTDQLLDTPQSPESIAQSLYLFEWLALVDSANPPDAAERDLVARSEVARIFALPKEQMPVPVRLALFGAKSQLTEAEVRRAGELCDSVDALGNLSPTPAEVVAMRDKADAHDRLLADIGAARYLLVDRHALEGAAKQRGLPVAAFNTQRAVNEPGFWADWLAELGQLQHERDEAEERARSALGLREDTMRVVGEALTRIAAAVHLKNATAGEVADAAVARIEALERDNETLRTEVAQLRAAGKPEPIRGTWTTVRASRLVELEAEAHSRLAAIGKLREMGVAPLDGESDPLLALVYGAGACIDGHRRALEVRTQTGEEQRRWRVGLRDDLGLPTSATDDEVRARARDLTGLRDSLAGILVGRGVNVETAAGIVDGVTRIVADIGEQRTTLAHLQHDNEAAMTFLQSAGLKPAEHAGAEPPLVSLARRAVDCMRNLAHERDSIQRDSANAAERSGRLCREAAKQLREVGEMLDGAARAAGVPWHELKGWCEVAKTAAGEARAWLAWASGFIGPSTTPQIARERLTAMVNGLQAEPEYMRQRIEAAETMRDRTAEAERAATMSAGRWRRAMQRLAVFLGVERPDSVQPEDLEDMCKGAVRAMSLQPAMVFTAKNSSCPHRPDGDLSACDHCSLKG